MSNEWCYSFDGETFDSNSFSSQQDALKSAQKEAVLQEKDVIYLATCETPSNSQFFPDADLITDHMACQADDVGGEYAEGYPDASKEQEQQLTDQLHKLLEEWCKNCGIAPSFFRVGEAETYDAKTLKKIS